MTCIVTNQQKEESITAGTAFRFAYSQAKYFKAWIWGTTLLFALVQTAVSAYVFSNGQAPLFDPTPYVVSLLLTSIIVGSFGKLKVTSWQDTGCSLQRLHDFLVMGIGTKPSQLELPKSKAILLSNKQLKKAPTDNEEFKKWWTSSLKEVPFPVAKVIATYSTFSWEKELRKQYQGQLNALLICSLVAPVIAALALNYTVSQAIIFTIAPFTPFISVVLDEWLSNKKSLKIAEKLTSECFSTWNNILANKLSNIEIETSTEQHMNLWQGFRQAATPIFDWLYSRSQNTMEMAMIIDNNELIKNYNNSKKLA